MDRTFKAALIGNGIGASLTPAMHMREGQAQGMQYRYDLFDTQTHPYSDMSIGELIDYAQDNRYQGLNITFPFKRTVMDVLDHIDPIARDLLAVNTVHFGENGSTGYNTDYFGYKSALNRHFVGKREDHVLLMGAGGAGGAVGLALVDFGLSHVTICDQDPSAAARVAAHIKSIRPKADVTTAPIGTLDTLRFDGIVNATPMGMAKFPGMAVSVTTISRAKWVSDIVYFPLKTALLNTAEHHGRATMNGSAMAVGQAIKSFEIFTGAPANSERMHDSFAILHAQKSDA